jgi:hydroxyacylglutathione hydrolase
MLYVRQLTLGPMQNFVYLVGAQTSKEIAVIDPAWDVPAILEAAQRDDKRIAAAIVSHHHFDHINGLEDLLKAVDVPVYAQQAELDFAEVLREHGSAMRGVGPGEVVKVGELELKLIHTPGHTPGSQCVFCGGALVSGDTVFVNACGRCDLPGGDPRLMHDSLTRVLAGLPDETVLYPGHDYGDVQVSSLGREREQNPYFQLADVGDFLSRRMRPKLT